MAFMVILYIDLKNVRTYKAQSQIILRHLIFYIIDLTFITKMLTCETFDSFVFIIVLSDQFSGNNSFWAN